MYMYLRERSMKINYLVNNIEIWKFNTSVLECDRSNK